MSSLSERPEITGFFSYSREDDADSAGRVSNLRDAIERELGAQLGRNSRTFRLWQDQTAIDPGKLWESEIAKAIAEAIFFIPVVTPRSVSSPHCRREFEAFLARERELGREDLVFPIYYMLVQSFDDETKRVKDGQLAIIAKRQYVDWRSFRHQTVNAPTVAQSIEQFCGGIVEALKASWLSPEERRRQEEEERKREAAEVKKRAAEESRRKREEETRRRLAAEKRRQREANEAKERAVGEARRKREEANARRAAEELRRQEVEEVRRKQQAEAEARRRQNEANARRAAEELRRQEVEEAVRKKRADAWKSALFWCFLVAVIAIVYHFRH
jgi:TIR domain